MTVEKRVRRLTQRIPFSSWFVDCDAYGELFDNYSKLFPTTQQQDMQARLDRMAWISDTETSDKYIAFMPDSTCLNTINYIYL